MTPRAWKKLFARVVLWTGIGIGLVLLGLLGDATWTIYLKSGDALKARSDAAGELSGLEARERSLSSDLDALGTPRGVEADIRETYPLAKAGEKVIVLTDTASTTDQAREQESPWSWISAWFSW